MGWRIPYFLFLCPMLGVLGLFVADGCGPPAPEKPGDACYGDEDHPCPEGTYCSGDEGNDRCMIPPGGKCNPIGTNYCWRSTCAVGICSVGVGEICDPNVGDMCLGSAACSTSGSASYCLIPPGYPCQMAGGFECTQGHECVANPSGDLFCMPP